eukprot:363205-Chlamydomonas_euryale.AAC.16
MQEAWACLGGTGAGGTANVGRASGREQQCLEDTRVCKKVAIVLDRGCWWALPPPVRPSPAHWRARLPRPCSSWGLHIPMPHHTAPLPEAYGLVCGCTVPVHTEPTAGLWPAASAASALPPVHATTPRGLEPRQPSPAQPTAGARSAHAKPPGCLWLRRTACGGVAATRPG